MSASRQDRSSAKGLAEFLSGPLFISVLLALVTFAVYFTVLHNQFVNYDDQDYVTSNDQVKAGLTGHGVLWAFTSGHASNWHPLTWLTHMFDWQLFGSHAAGHHLT